MNISSFPALIARPEALVESVSFFVSKQVKSLFILADPFMAQSSLLAPLMTALDEAEMKHVLYSSFSGEPKLSMMDEIIALCRKEGCDGVIGIGGGSALDMAKIASIVLAADRPADDYWMMAHPLPAASLPSVMVPTTAGTGSESCSTNIIANRQGHKGWIWGPETKPDLIIHDPVLGVSLPANLTGWCGMDAFIHAFEASTNIYAHDSARAYGHQALKLIVEALPRAIADGTDLEARQKMLLASAWAGAAIDQVGTAVAHHISHAMASLAPIHHGHATAIGFEATLAWIIAGLRDETAIEKFQSVADTLGVSDFQDLPQFVSDFMDICQIDRRLPQSMAAFDKEALVAQMMADHTQSMRVATSREVTDEAIIAIVDHLAELPVHAS
ncbi:MAG: iron-containing alcohol dehydrogenase [Candidatus Puniceispirillaceae bacterium]